MRRGGSSCIFLLLPVAFVLCTSPPFPQWGTILLIVHAWSREKPSFWPWFSEAGEDQWNLDTYSRSFILSSYSSLTEGIWTWSIEKKQAPKICMSLRKPEAGLEQKTADPKTIIWYDLEPIFFAYIERRYILLDHRITFDRRSVMKEQLHLPSNNP